MIFDPKTIKPHNMAERMAELTKDLKDDAEIPFFTFGYATKEIHEGQEAVQFHNASFGSPMSSAMYHTKQMLLIREGMKRAGMPEATIDELLSMIEKDAKQTIDITNRRMDIDNEGEGNE